MRNSSIISVALRRLRELIRITVWLSPILLLFFTPYILSSFDIDRQSGSYFRFPRIFSGDEPHYLVMVNSLLKDGDLDLANNYQSVHNGGNEAGEVKHGSALDHHICWLINGQKVNWIDVYEQSPDKWGRDHFGHPVPTPTLSSKNVNIPPQEYSWHQSGMPVLVACLLFPLRNTDHIESGAIFCSCISMIVAIVFFFLLIRPYFGDHRDAIWTTAIAFLGTPAWHYGRTLFTEPYLLASAMGGYSLYLRYSRPLLAGTLLGIGILTKRSMILLCFPLIVDALLRRDWVSALKISGTAAASLLLLAVQNQYLFGSPIGFDSQGAFGNPIKGALGLLFSLKHGILFTAPAAFVVIGFWPRFFRSHLREASILASAFLLYFAFWSSVLFWPGSICYGPRYMIPVIPFLFVAFSCSAKQLSSYRFVNLTINLTIEILIVVSIYINFIAAEAYGKVWESHPITYLLELSDFY